jgi:hypothetical protein
VPPSRPAELTPSEPLDPLADVAASARSPRARRGLTTRRRLFARRTQTHQLLRLWRRVGQLLAGAEEQFNKRDASELLKLVGKISEALDGFPPLFGEAGQPGYMLLTLTQLDSPQDIVKLDHNQLHSLQRDWKAGLTFLRAHRDYLRQELRLFRRHSRQEQMTRAISTYLGGRLGAFALVVLGLLALGIALLRTYFSWVAG